MVKTAFQLFLICLVLIGLTACKRNIGQFDEYVFSVQLVNDSTKIKEYLEYHKNVWPEVEEGFIKAGYRNIKIYRFQNFLTMVIKIPKGADLDQIGASPALNTEKIKVWNLLMSSYQKGLPGTVEGATWVPMEKIYEFENDQWPK